MANTGGICAAVTVAAAIGATAAAVAVAGAADGAALRSIVPSYAYTKIHSLPLKKTANI